MMKFRLDLNPFSDISGEINYRGEQMIGIIGGWAFATFLYFKIVFDAAFSRDITIIAALLMGVAFGVLVFTFSGVYAMRLLEFNWSPGKITATVSQLISRTIIPLIGAVIVYGLVARLLIFGFSKKLNYSIDVFNYRGNIDKDFVTFVLIIFLPIIVHYAMSIYGTYINANRTD